MAKSVKHLPALIARSEAMWEDFSTTRSLVQIKVWCRMKAELFCRINSLCERCHFGIKCAYLEQGYSHGVN